MRPETKFLTDKKFSKLFDECIEFVDNSLSGQLSVCDHPETLRATYRLLLQDSARGCVIVPKNNNYTLHHYTSVGAFIDIYRNGLALYDNIGMNDSKDYQYKNEMADVFAKSGDRLFMDKDASRREEFNKNQKLITAQLGLAYTYSHCMSRKTDNLDHWRTYGESGVEIIYDAADLFEFLNDYAGTFLYPMIYDINKQVTLLFVHMLLSTRFLDAMRSLPNKEDGDLRRAYIGTSAMETFVTSLFKSPHFKDEREHRIFTFPNQLLIQDRTLPPKFTYSGKDGFLRSSVYLSGLSRDLGNQENTSLGLIPIKAVRVGPGPHQEERAYSISSALELIGHYNDRPPPEILTSNLSVRF